MTNTQKEYEIKLQFPFVVLVLAQYEHRTREQQTLKPAMLIILSLGSTHNDYDYNSWDAHLQYNCMRKILM